MNQYPSLTFSLLCLIILLAGACKKESGISHTPEIRLVDVSPLEITALSDSIKFTVWYRDGNGDLGENNADVENLFIQDPRIGSEYPFRIPLLAPEGSEIAIQGTLDVYLSNVGITDGSAEQSVVFSVYAVDRAGNQSNIETASEVVIRE